MKITQTTKLRAISVVLIIALVMTLFSTTAYAQSPMMVGEDISIKVICDDKIQILEDGVISTLTSKKINNETEKIIINSENPDGNGYFLINEDSIYSSYTGKTIYNNEIKRDFLADNGFSLTESSFIENENNTSIELLAANTPSKKKISSKAYKFSYKTINKYVGTSFSVTSLAAGIIALIKKSVPVVSTVSSVVSLIAGSIALITSILDGKYPNGGIKVTVTYYKFTTVKQGKEWVYYQHHITGVTPYKS